MTEQQRRAMYAGAIPALAQKYEKRETPAAYWYRTDTGQKYKYNKNKRSWKIIDGDLYTFTKFIEQNLDSLPV